MPKISSIDHIYCTALSLCKISIHPQLSLTSFENNITSLLQTHFSIFSHFYNPLRTDLRSQSGMYSFVKVCSPLCVRKNSPPRTCEIAKQDCCVRIYTTISYVTFLMLYTHKAHAQCTTTASAVAAAAVAL